MDEVQRLIDAFRAGGEGAGRRAGRIAPAARRAPRVAPFLRAVLADGAEPVDVRIDALRRLRAAPLAPADRAALAGAALRVLRAEPTDGVLRQHAALAL